MVRTAFLALVAGALPLAASTLTVYRDLTSWTVATQNTPADRIDTENFAGDQITLPGLHIDRLELGHPNGSGCDLISGGTCYTGVSPSHELIMHLDNPVYGFSADFNYVMTGGVGVWLGNAAGRFNLNEIVLDPPGVHSCDLMPVCDEVNGFAGFVTDFPFTYLYFDNTVQPGQAFAMSNLKFAADAPEPSTLALISLSIVMMCLWKRRKLSSTMHALLR